jgi:hypothetical protein
VSTKPELYREVFNSPAGREVFADICGYVERMNVSEPGSAGKLIAHIARMKDQPAAAAPKPRVVRASGGRIAHG